MRSQYYARVGGLGSTAETVHLDEDSDRAAIVLAFGARTPFGHSLWNGRRFLGYFDAGDFRIEGERPVRAIAVAGPGLPC